MTPDPQLIDSLQKLGSEGNTVAPLVLSLLQTSYSDDAAGFRAALDDAFAKVAELRKQAFQQPLPLQLPVPRNSALLTMPAPSQTRYSAALEHAGALGQLWDRPPGGIPNYPGPLSSMAVLGLLGAGTGRFAGHALDKLTGRPDPDRKSRYTRIGAALGVLPGVGYAIANAAAGQPAFTGQVLNTPRKFSFDKYSAVVPVEQLQDMIWNDPWVANRLPLSMVAATSALVEGAQRVASPDRSMPFVTPVDVARMAVGLGSGYGSGLLVGKALGALFGVSDKSQEILRRSGAAAGLIRSVVPLAYGH